MSQILYFRTDPNLQPLSVVATQGGAPGQEQEEPQEPGDDEETYPPEDEPSEDYPSLRVNGTHVGTNGTHSAAYVKV